MNQPPKTAREALGDVPDTDAFRIAELRHTVMILTEKLFALNLEHEQVLEKLDACRTERNLFEKRWKKAEESYRGMKLSRNLAYVYGFVGAVLVGALKGC